MTCRAVFCLGMLWALSSGCSVDRLLLRPSIGFAGAPGQAGFIDRPNGPPVRSFTLGTSSCADSEPLALVLCLNGRSDRAEWQIDRVASAWRPYPVELVAINYPGYGDSPGPATVANALSSAEAAFDTLRARAADRPVFVHANSFGCAVALHLSATRPVAGLVLQNPPPFSATFPLAVRPDEPVVGDRTGGVESAARTGRVAIG